ncbi:hypothetical protein OL383_004424 [Salmonella enterica]|nr:hypothetical protein [Salmonella enterica]
MTISNIQPGHGRNKGSINKSTRERTEAFREKLEKSNVFFIALNELLRRFEECPEQIKTADLLKVTTTYAPYLFTTVSQDEIAEQIAEIASREDAERVAAMIAGQLRLVK